MIDEFMNNKKKIDFFRIVLMGINIILMFVMLVIQNFAYNAIICCILCACILLLITVIFVLDVIVKNVKNMFLLAFFYACWITNLIIHLFNI